MHPPKSVANQQASRCMLSTLSIICNVLTTIKPIVPRHHQLSHNILLVGLVALIIRPIHHGETTNTTVGEQ